MKHIVKQSIVLFLAILFGVANPGARAQDFIQSPQPLTPAKSKSTYNKTALLLFAGDVAIRIEDARATMAFQHDSCKCYEEAFLSHSISGSTAGMYTYSIGLAVLLNTASRLVYHSGHHKLAYLIPAADIVSVSTVQVTMNR